MTKLIFQRYHDNPLGAYKTEKLGAYMPIDELAALSQRRMKAYAESIGADYILLDEPRWSGVRAHPAWTRWAMFDYWDQYDEMCYVDCDVLPTQAAFGVSVFDTEGTAKLTERPAGTREAWHVNAGVFKVTCQEAFKLKSAIQSKQFIRQLEETGKNQEQFNEAWKQTFRRKPKHFGTAWNATRPEHREGEYYLHHYIGHQKTVKGNQWGTLLDNGVYQWNLEEDKNGG